jgi:hypothetical protein
MASDGAVRERKEKGGRVMKKGEIAGIKEEDSNLHSEKVNLGRAAVVHHFSGCDSRESWSQTYKLQQFEQRESEDLR